MNDVHEMQCYDRPMAPPRHGKPGLSADEAERVRSVLLHVRDTRFGGSGRQLAAALNVTASSVSQITTGKNRASYLTAKSLATLLQVDPADVLAGRVGTAEPDRYPERALALTRLRGLLPPAVEASVRSVVLVEGRPFTEADWIRDALMRLSEHEAQLERARRISG